MYIFSNDIYSVAFSKHNKCIYDRFAHTHTHKHIYTQCTILNDTAWESVMLSGEREGSKRLAVELSLHRCSCAG